MLQGTSRDKRLSHGKEHQSPRLDPTSQPSRATFPGPPFQGLTLAPLASEHPQPTGSRLPLVSVCLPPAPWVSYLCSQLSAGGAGGLLDLNVHLSKELLALANVLTQGVVVLNQAQDMAATLAGPQLVARDQARHARGAGGGGATVTGEGVPVISREWRSL